MKTIFTFAFAFFASALLSQSFSVYKINNSGMNTATITNGGNLQDVTAPNGTTNTKIKIKNNAATTQTFNVIRSLVFNSPSLYLNGSAAKPTSYFCFGYSCFTNSVNTASPADYTILLPSGQTSTTFPYADNSVANSQPFSIYLDEGSTIGNYVMRYKVFNVNNPNDTLAFTLSYNAGVGVKKNENSADFITTVYPNPASAESTLLVQSNQNQQASLFIYNSLGELVKTNNFSLISGSNDLKFNCAELNAGVYSLVLTTNQGSVVKKLNVSK